MKGSKWIIRVGSVGLFITSFYGMIYFGYRTFYIEPEHLEYKAYDYHFVLISEELDNDYWRLIEQGAKKAAEEQNVYLEYVGPRKADNDQLLKRLDRMIATKVDGIIVQGVGGQEFEGLIFKSVENGIPVVTIDTDVKNSVRNAYIGSNNYYAGQLAGEMLIENTVGAQYVGIVMGRFDAINQQERIAGFKDAIQASERIQIIDEKESGITQSGAAQATYALLKENSSITALVGFSALDGIGIVEGLQEFPPNKEVYISAFDLLPRTMELIKNEKIDLTIVQYPKEMGYESVQVLTELQQHDLLESKIYTPTRVMKKENIKEDGFDHNVKNN